jgi:hypothetical protein
MRLIGSYDRAPCMGDVRVRRIACTTNGPAGLQTAASIWSLQQTLSTSADLSFSKSTRGACTLTVQHALPGLSQGTGNHAAVTESGTIIPCTWYLRDGD